MTSIIIRILIQTIASPLRHPQTIVFSDEEDLDDSEIVVGDDDDEEEEDIEEGDEGQFTYNAHAQKDRFRDNIQVS